MALNDRAEADAAMQPLIGRKWEVFAFHHINSSQRIWAGKQLTHATYSSKRDDFIEFLTVKLL